MKVTVLEVSGWGPAIKALRNPKKTWSDSDTLPLSDDEEYINYVLNTTHPDWSPGPKDSKLIKSLVRAGSSHRKVIRFPSVYLDVVAGLKFWDEFATYKFVDCSSTSAMHTLTDTAVDRLIYDTEEMEEDDLEVLDTIIAHMNKKIAEFNSNQLIIKTTTDIKEKHLLKSRNKKLFNALVKINPQGFLYVRTIKLNYETLIRMYVNRHEHKLYDWVVFCDVVRKEVPFLDDMLSVIEERYGSNHGF